MILVFPLYCLLNYWCYIKGMRYLKQTNKQKRDKEGEKETWKKEGAIKILKKLVD